MNSGGGGPGVGAEPPPIVPPLRLKRQQRARFTEITVAIVLPWLIFFLVVSLFLFAFHDMKVLVWVLLGGIAVLSLLFLLIGVCSRNGTFLAIGFLSLVSLGAGTAMGLWLDKEYLQRYWELDGGLEFKDVDPTEDIRKTKDAAVIHFAPGSFVDDRRTVGYVAKGGIFCVAPVALPSFDNVPIGFWAVGEDCCQMRSNFDCGTARDLDALTTVVERPAEIYHKAIQQAISVYGVRVPTNGSKLVSFVNDPQVVAGDIWDEALTIALISMIMDLCLCAVCGLVLAGRLVAMAAERQPLLKGGV